MPGHVRWMGVIPMEGLAGRIVGDVLIHYLNPAGAYIVCATVLAIALYLTTAFSFASLRVWAPTRFAFVVALWNRYKDWQENRAKKKMQKELEKRRATRPTVTAQLIPARSPPLPLTRLSRSGPLASIAWPSPPAPRNTSSSRSRRARSRSHYSGC